MTGPATPRPSRPVPAKAEQFTPIQSMSQLVRGLWAAVATPTLPAATVIVHDPDAKRPHDLDDPFLSQRAQTRMGNVIAKAAQKK